MVSSGLTAFGHKNDGFTVPLLISERGCLLWFSSSGAIVKEAYFLTGGISSRKISTIPLSLEARLHSKVEWVSTFQRRDFSVEIKL